MPTRNPYSSGGAFPDLSPTINNFVDNLVRLKTHQDDIDMKGRALQETTRQHNIGAFGTETPTPGMETIPERQLAETARARTTAEDANKLARDKFQTENPRERLYEMSNFMETISKLELAGVSTEDLPFLNGDLKAFAADKKLKRGDIADAVEMNWPEWTAQSADSLEQKAGKLSKQAAALPKNDPKLKEIMGQLEKVINTQKTIESIPADKVKQVLFKDVYQYDQAQEAKQKQEGMDQVKAEIVQRARAERRNLTDDEKALLGIKPGPTRSVAPGGTLVDESGKVVYSNPNRPAGSDRPLSVAPGGTLVSPKTGKPIYTAPEKGPTDAEKRQTAKLIADAESQIILNPGPEAAGQADLFNQYAEKPYAYTWNENKGTFKGAAWDKVKLPKIKGKQVTAKDVYDTATQRGMTYEDVLRAIGALK
ncbi:MAG: hypothetical protein ABIJ57_16140 [Pseudomonadota bacterium]